MAASIQSGRFAQLIQSLQSEGGGVLRLDVVKRGDMPRLLASAMTGDAEALCLSRMASQVLDQIATAPKRLPKLCASCPRPVLNKPFALVLMRPACNAPSQGTGVAVCRRCATTRAAIKGKALLAVRKVWPEAHVASSPDGSGARH